MVLSALTAACLGYIFAISHLFPWQHASQQQLFDNLRLPCKFYESAGCYLGVAVHLKQLSQHVYMSLLVLLAIFLLWDGKAGSSLAFYINRFVHKTGKRRPDSSRDATWSEFPLFKPLF